MQLVLNVPLGNCFFISIVVMFAVQRLCAAFINLVVKLSAVGIYHIGDIMLGGGGAVCEEFPSS